MTTLLYSGYPYSRTLLLDLYGNPGNDDHANEVTKVTLHGDDRDISEPFRDDVMEQLCEWLDRRTAPADMEGLIAQAEQDRLLRQYDHIWVRR